MIVNAFYENVARHKTEHRDLAPGEVEENVVLEFRPEPQQDMLVACLWSFTKGGEGEADLYSFAAITDAPPAEVAAAGHDRCIVLIQRENVEAWLHPDPKIWQHSMPFSKTAADPITSIGWWPEPRSFG